MTVKALILAASALALTAGAADAGTPWIKHRQQHQLNRIGNGVGSGALNAGETARLLNGQARVANLRANAKADGVVTLGERLRIHGAQNWQSLRIYHLKHN